jgi:hypothetical protein
MSDIDETFHSSGTPFLSHPTNPNKKHQLFCVSTNFVCMAKRKPTHKAGD